ncbi:MAG: hypothetical protein CL850_04615, partial [Crocinitomicaceae bacterium]|nr:hypothetical protein [Crocinitomicaceae bacterium]
MSSGSACLNEDGETNLNFIPSNGCGSSNWSQWSVISSNGDLVGILAQGSPPGLNFYNVLINQQGTYTISDGTESIDFIVYPKPTYTSTVSSEYYLCEDSVNVQFEIEPGFEFTNFSWIGSATESDNVVNGQFGDPSSNVFTGTYLNPGEYDLNAQFNHIESGCLVRTEDDLTQDINITVVDGPSSDNISLSYSTNYEYDPNCIELGSSYDLLFDQSFPISASIFPSTYTVNTTDNPNILLETFQIPVTIEYDSIGCSITTQITHEHSVISTPSFSTGDFEGYLCNNESITLTNTSGNINTGGSYQWNIEGAENIEENGPDVTFTYPEDGDYAWSLTYTDPSEVCTSVFDTTISVNVDLITADFTVDNALICDSEGT